VLINNPSDNYWSVAPERTIEFMKEVKQPWLAFKVLAAGAIHPKDGFKFAYENGADFVLAGMFDFQVAQDAQIARQIIAAIKDRPRPWRG